MQNNSVYKDMDNAFSKAIIEQVWTARQPSTIKKYCYSLRNFFSFLCIFSSTIILPITAMDAAKYLAYLRVNSASHSTYKIIFTAIKWINNFFPGVNKFNCPLEDNFLLRLKDSALRSTPVKKNQKEVITGDILQRIISTLPLSAPLLQIRNVLMPCLAYSLLLRHDELSHLNCLYMTEDHRGIQITIPSSKTDVYRNGKRVFLAKNTSSNSVYAILKRYLTASSLEMGKNHFLFTPMVDGRLMNKKLSYSVFSNNIKQMMASLGFDASFFGTHSLRSGGATDLSTKVTEFELLLSGRWRDPRSLNSYVKVSDERRFAISRELSLASP